MNKKLYVWTLATGMLAMGWGMAGCSNDNDVPGQTGKPETTEPEAQSLYVIPAVVGEASYLITAESLDKGEVSVEGKGTEVLNAS